MSNSWAEDDAVDRAVERRQMTRYFANVVDPTFQTHFCKRCMQPTMKYEDRLDAGGNIEEQWDSHCARCRMAMASGASIGCDEQAAS